MCVWCEGLCECFNSFFGPRFTTALDTHVTKSSTRGLCVRTHTKDTSSSWWVESWSQLVELGAATCVSTYLRWAKQYHNVFFVPTNSRQTVPVHSMITVPAHSRQTVPFHSRQTMPAHSRQIEPVRSSPQQADLACTQQADTAFAF